MLLNLAWFIPGLPIIASVFILILLVSFSKTMNRLTKPVSLTLIFSVILAEIIDFILFEGNTSGIISLSEKFRFIGNGFKLVIDSQALIVSFSLGLIFLLIMLVSFIKLKRRNGYVRYFISLGFLIGLVYVFTFSGTIFHNFLDPFISTLDKTGLPIL